MASGRSAWKDNEQKQQPNERVKENKWEQRREKSRLFENSPDAIKSIWRRIQRGLFCFWVWIEKCRNGTTTTQNECNSVVRSEAPKKMMRNRAKTTRDNTSECERRQEEKKERCGDGEQWLCDIVINFRQLIPIFCCRALKLKRREKKESPNGTHKRQQFSFVGETKLFALFFHYRALKTPWKNRQSFSLQTTE